MTEFLANHADILIPSALLVAILRNSFRISSLTWALQSERATNESQSNWISSTSERVAALEAAERARKELAK